jgi:hypothetical protein
MDHSAEHGTDHGTHDRTPTRLSEDLLLLCGSPDDGRIRQPGSFRLALAGGTLAELLAAGAATVEGGNRFVLLHPGPLGHPALDQAATALAGYAGPPRGARLRSCLSRLARRSAAPYLESLVERGLAQRRTRRLLGLVPVARYTLTAPGTAARKWLVAQIADAVANPDTVADPDAVGDLAALPRALRLAALAHAGDLTARLYPGPVANRAARRRLAALTRLDPVATAVQAATRAARNAQTGAG